MGGRPSLIGATVGNYRVVSKLGEGGMGAVYLAEHPLIGKKVALKVLHPELARSPDVVTRFFNEARAVNEIGHPNIVDVVDYGVVVHEGANLVYFMMELLVGESLGDLLKREGPLSCERALRIAIQIGEALAACHDKGVIHRDLKPDNVFLVPRGSEEVVKVLDFGVAKLTGTAGKEMSRTRTGVVLGTPTYMAPEQCEGRRNIDARADVYSLGVILYEMITGKVPFTGESYGEIILQHIAQPPARPSTIQSVIPAAVEAIVLRALEKRREHRFASMEVLVAALGDPERYASDPEKFGELPSRRRSTVPQRRVPASLRWTRGSAHATTLSHSAAELGARTRTRARAPVVAASAVVVLGALAAGAFLLFGRRDGEGPAAGPVAVPQAAAAPAPVRPPPPVPVRPPPPAPVRPPPPAPAAAPRRIQVSVSSTPPGAQVLIDEQSRGVTPIVIDLPRGAHGGRVKLSLQLEGYKTRRKTLSTTRDADLEIALEREHHHHHHARRTPTPDAAAATPAPAEKPPARKASEDDILAPSFPVKP